MEGRKEGRKEEGKEGRKDGRKEGTQGRKKGREGGRGGRERKQGVGRQQAGKWARITLGPCRRHREDGESLHHACPPARKATVTCQTEDLSSLEILGHRMPPYLFS